MPEGSVWLLEIKFTIEADQILLRMDQGGEQGVGAGPEGWEACRSLEISKKRTKSLLDNAVSALPG